jgi:hypothetical protein
LPAAVQATGASLTFWVYALSIFSLALRNNPVQALAHIHDQVPRFNLFSDGDSTNTVSRGLRSQGEPMPPQAFSSTLHHAVMPREDLGPDGGTAIIAGQPVGTVAQLSDYLVNGYWAWSGTVAHHWTSNTITYNLGNLDPSERDLALTALAAWSEVANIAFVQAEAANINFNHNGNMTAFTSGNWIGSGQMISATVDISSNWITSDGGANDGHTGVYSYGFQTYIHEIGHALGLGHQGPYNGSATYGTDNVYANDSWQLSIMSYFPQSYYNGGSYDYVITPQMADIAAVQSIYGASGTRAGNTVYGFNSNAGPLYNFSQYTGLGTPSLTIYDSGGSDTLDCSGYSQNQILDITPGAFCSVGGYIHNIGVFSTTLIEAAIGGTGSDMIIGNSADNELIGGIGNDTIAGQGGNDIIDGGPGTDTVAYSGIRSQYQITQNSNGSFHIFDFRPGAPEGTDDAWNVEFFQFADRAVSTSDVFNYPPSSEPDLFAADHDFNGDGKADILLQHDSGLPVIWTMDGTTITGGAVLPNVGPTWHVAATADFNGDGKADILLQHDSGLPVIWTMDGTTISGGAVLPNAGPTWHVAAAADFNGDGKADILLQHDSGLPVIWTMNGTTITGAAVLPDVGPTWDVAAAEDFSGDGKADILLEHDSGLPVIWIMDGTTVTAGVVLPNPGSDWDLL